MIGDAFIFGYLVVLLYCASLEIWFTELPAKSSKPDMRTPKIPDSNTAEQELNKRLVDLLRIANSEAEKWIDRARTQLRSVCSLTEIATEHLNRKLASGELSMLRQIKNIRIQQQSVIDNLTVAECIIAGYLKLGGSNLARRSAHLQNLGKDCFAADTTAQLAARERAVLGKQLDELGALFIKNEELISNMMCSCLGWSSAALIEGRPIEDVTEGGSNNETCSH